MVLNLEKDMVLDLSKVDNGLTSLAVGVNWGKISKGGLFGFGASQEDVDLDLSALMYDKDNKIVNKVFFGNLSANGVKHSGDDLKGDSEADDSDNETITVDLTKVSPAVTKIVFVLVSFRGQDFGDLPYANINLYDTTVGKTKIANSLADISKDRNFKGKTSMVFATLENKNGSWEYKINNLPTEKSSLDQLVSYCSNL